MDKKDISFPRFMIRRKILRAIGRFLIRRLTKFRIVDENLFPPEGPYIVAGNHVAAMEGMLMALFSPKPIEIIGSDDIPIDPNLAFFVNLYGFLPIKRGMIDQRGLKVALAVLKSGERIGIFPEGGIWSDEVKEAKIGVSWLAYQAKVPVVPVGFVGMKGALKKMLRFRFPEMEMRVGKPMLPENIFDDGLPLKNNLQLAANRIMEEIVQLIPESTSQLDSDQDVNPFEFSEIYLFEPSQPGKKIDFQNKQEFIRLISHPVIMDVFKRNLKMRIDSLLVRNKPVKVQKILSSSKLILDYLDENPGFLPYRFGNELAAGMTDGLKSFYNLLFTYEKNENLMIAFEQ